MVNGKELQIHQCKLGPKVAKAPKPEARSGLVRRDFGLSGAPCTTYCNSGSGGPDPNGMQTPVVLLGLSLLGLQTALLWQGWLTLACFLWLLILHVS
jgi:hypothetical protein